MITIKRIYDPPSKDDGYRVLVDRLWPRGMSKEKAHVDLWLRDIAPSNELRKWFNHEPQKWTGFKERYFAEIALQKELLEPLKKKMKETHITLLYGAKEPHINNAVVLKEYLEKM
ncbi:MAG TPA: DUF488 domain-containing protein [Syntrophorhabdus sp.]|jgi:uncharacterized protein YeaO (DUF488 family)|nr:DUF488 domain-containing protein [Syntrophorhabdus sp.]MDI9556754.1 DUF488 domain-containing protein [Pseudomonadota bacterium]OPX96522.1 MAG: hypothetical protein A4E59_01129 [Syntrophorhabdus sp. PtaB.Bin027]OQB76718.1 MAG: hypothetical protein BWX92_01563 [Deltaproteobacteria bacterium ADurb.Bin135]MBP8745156.1 DUF488 domain-containing protein [Syntrophorhabdus sp.]